MHDFGSEDGEQFAQLSDSTNVCAGVDRSQHRQLVGLPPQCAHLTHTPQNCASARLGA